MTPADQAAERLELSDAALWSVIETYAAKTYFGMGQDARIRVLREALLSERRKPDPSVNLGAEPSLVSPPPPLPPQLLALSKAATPKGWGILHDQVRPVIVNYDGMVVARAEPGYDQEHNAKFIVAAANYIRSCESAGAESTPGEGI